MPHQWVEGNLPVNSRCVVCDKTCGSIRQLQDFWCLWCHSVVRLVLLYNYVLVAFNAVFYCSYSKLSFYGMQLLEQLQCCLMYCPALLTTVSL